MSNLLNDMDLHGGSTPASLSAAASLIRILLLCPSSLDNAELETKLAESRRVHFDVSSSTDLAQGLHQIRRQRFDVVLADLHWPGREHTSLLAELKTSSPHTPILILVNEHHGDEALEVMRAGAQDYLVKSRLNASALERILLYCIERQRVARRTSAQYAVSRALAESENADQAGSKVLRALCEFADCQRAQLWNCDRQTGTLHLGQVWTSDGPDAGPPGGDFGVVSLARGRGLPGSAWAAASPIWLAPLDEHADVPQAGAAAIAGFRYAIAFPVRLGAEVRAVIELYSRYISSTDDDFLDLVMNIGEQLGQFLARKVAEHEREQLTRERLLILDCVSDGIYGVDLHGGITFMNRAAAAMLQCAPEAVLGRVAHDLFCQKVGEKFVHSLAKCPITRTIATSQGVRTERHDLRRADETSFEAECSIFPLTDGDHVKGAVVCVSDITERKRMEVELRHAQKLEAVGSLAAGIAHEINTPIQFVGDNARFLQDAFQQLAALVSEYETVCEAAAQGQLGSESLAHLHAVREKSDWDYLKSEIPKALEQSLDGVGRVATIVRGMKEFSHVDRSPEKTASDLNKAIESTLIVARNELKYVADIETHFGDIPLVLCHLGDLNQVFLNLLINAAHAIGDAVKGTSKKGRITVTTRRDGNWVEVSVTDTGTGVPEAVRNKIFDPFFTTKEVGRGTGQGLALARAVVVERHGGTLTFETEMGRGTTFFVRLPLAGIPEEHEGQNDETNPVCG